MLQALDVVCAFTDAELVRGLQRLVKADRTLSAELLVHLGEVEARGLYREHAYSTMFDYCRSALGMSDAEAGLRVLAARVGRRFPLVVERLGMGALNLTAIKLLAPHLTADNHVQLLDRVSSMSKRDIEVLLADLAPKPDVPARIRKLPERRVAVRSAVATEHREGRNSSFTPAESNTTVMPATSGTVATTSGTGIADACSTAAADVCSTAAADACSTAAADVCSTAAADGAGVAAINSTAAVTTSDTAVAATTAAILRQPSALNAGSRAVQPAAARVAANASSSTFALQPTRPRATSKPLGLGRFDVHLTLGQEAHTALEQLVELFRHQNPRGDFTTIIERALFELLKSTMKRRFGQTNSAQPQRTHQPANPRPNIDNKLTPHGRNNAKHHGRNNAENHRTNNAENHRSNNAENHRSNNAENHRTNNAENHRTNNAENHRTNNAENHRPNNAEHDVRNIEHGGQTTAVRANTERDRRTNTERDVRAVGATNVRAEARSADGRSTKSRYIPRAVLREVHARDMGQCTYVSPDGRRCSARGFLEVHHHNTAFARGGEATVENLRLVCRAHNLFFAERDYGRGLMQSKMREAAARKQLSLVPEQNQA